MFRRILHHLQGELIVTCSKLSAICNITLVTKDKMYMDITTLFTIIRIIFANLLCFKIYVSYLSYF
jgi:hypothetical protein